MSVSNDDLELALTQAWIFLRKRYRHRAGYEPGEYVSVSFDKLDFPVRVTAYPHDGRALYRIVLPLADEVDFAVPDSALYLLSQMSDLVWGRFAVHGGGLRIEQTIFAANATGKQLAAVVYGVAVTGFKTTVDLRLLGALPHTEEAD